MQSTEYISHPIQQFHDFVFVSWEKDIYPTYVGQVNCHEQDFFVDFIEKNNLKKIIDLGVGGGLLLNSILNKLAIDRYVLESVEANEVDVEFIAQAHSKFTKDRHDVLIHKADRLALSNAQPAYTHTFDFAMLTGNSLTYLGGESREIAKTTQQKVINTFAQLIETGGYFLLDVRDYDYIQSLAGLSPKEVMGKYTFDYTTIYHGSGKDILVVPVHITDTLVVFHYYDRQRKIWSKLELFPIYHNDMLDILSQDFTIEKVLYDFQDRPTDKCILRQYIAKRK